MADRKVMLPVLEGRRRLHMGVGVKGSLGELPLSPSDSNFRITPRSQRFQTFDHSYLTRFTPTQSSKLTFKSTFRFPSDDPTDTHSAIYRSPAVQTKHEILLLLKELRRGPARPNIKHAKTLCLILETLAKEKGYYSEEMALIVKEMSKVLFCFRDTIPERVLQYIYEKDVEVMLQEDNLVPYFYVTDFLYGLVRQLWEHEVEMERKFEALTEKFEARVAEKDEEIEELLQKIADLSNAQMPMEKDLARVTEEIRLDKMEEKYRTVKVTLKDDMRLINDLESKVKMLNNTAMEASKALQTLETEHQDLLQNHMELRDEYKNCLVRVQQMGKRLEVVEEEKRSLEEQMYHLKVRAAASFEELTPRPSFAKVYELLSVDLPILPHTEDHISEVSKQIRNFQIRMNPSPRPRPTRKQQPISIPIGDGRNRSPSVEMFAEETEENQAS